MLSYKTMLAFFFLGKQSTWNYKLQFLCSANKRLEVNNAPNVTESKTYLLEQTRHLLISTNIKASKNLQKEEKQSTDSANSKYCRFYSRHHKGKLESDHHIAYSAVKLGKKKENQGFSFLYSFIPNCIQNNMI